MGCLYTYVDLVLCINLYKYHHNKYRRGLSFTGYKVVVILLIYLTPNKYVILWYTFLVLILLYFYFLNEDKCWTYLECQYKWFYLICVISHYILREMFFKFCPFRLRTTISNPIINETPSSYIHHCLYPKTPDHYKIKN